MFQQGHGRRHRHFLQTSTRLAAYDNWPGLKQVCRLTRTTFRNGQSTTEIQYAITSVPRSLAGAGELLSWWHGHWGIENRSHYVRDVTLQEDACRIRTGHAPQNFAALRMPAFPSSASRNTPTSPPPSGPVPGKLNDS